MWSGHSRGPTYVRFFPSLGARGVWSCESRDSPDAPELRVAREQEGMAMTLCVCDRCGAEFSPLAGLTESAWLCAECWRRAGMPWPSNPATAEEVQAAELATRERMLKRKGADRYMVRSGKAGL